jgi:hypothetical protein
MPTSNINIHLIDFITLYPQRGSRDISGFFRDTPTFHQNDLGMGNTAEVTDSVSSSVSTVVYDKRESGKKGEVQ